MSPLHPRRRLEDPRPHRAVHRPRSLHRAPGELDHSVGEGISPVGPIRYVGISGGAPMRMPTRMRTPTRMPMRMPTPTRMPTLTRMPMRTTMRMPTRRCRRRRRCGRRCGCGRRCRCRHDHRLLPHPVDTLDALSRGLSSPGHEGLPPRSTPGAGRAEGGGEPRRWSDGWDRGVRGLPGLGAAAPTTRTGWPRPRWTLPTTRRAR